MSFEILWQSQGVERRFGGVLAADQLFWAAESVAEESRARNLRWIVDDYTRIGGFKLTRGDLEVLAEMQAVETTGASGPLVAAVTPDGALAELLAAHARDAGSRQRFRVFSSRDEAMAWIRGREASGGGAGQRMPRSA